MMAHLTSPFAEVSSHPVSQLALVGGQLDQEASSERIPFCNKLRRNSMVNEDWLNYTKELVGGDYTLIVVSPNAL